VLTIIRHLHQEIARLRDIRYQELRTLLGTHAKETSLEPRLTVMEETQIVWDDKRDGNIRVILEAHLADGGRRRRLAVVDDFIKSPDDSFVGE
jgi:hypothetical protein